MNERIQKLYDQADKFAKENRTQTISGPGNNYFELFHEKFAQLIVQECIEIVEYKGRKVGAEHPVGFNLMDAAWDIRESFGVEL